jgi:hypothetical protein
MLLKLQKEITNVIVIVLYYIIIIIINRTRPTSHRNIFINMKKIAGDG